MVKQPAPPPPPDREAIASTAGAKLRALPRGDALVAEIIRRQKGSRTCLLSFSRGKDSIAAAIALRGKLELVPFFCYAIPGISFVEESLAYYERELFGGRHIHRCLQHSVVRQLNNKIFQPPERLAVTEAAQLVEYEYADVQAALVLELGLPRETLTVIGLRAADSIQRRTNFARQGPINPNKRTVAAIWEYTKDDVIRTIESAGLALPEDYLLFNRTFDGLMAEFLLPLKQKKPADYARIVELFPLCEAEVYRYQMIHGKDSP